MLSKENLQYFPTENTSFMKNENQDEENMIFSMQIEKLVAKIRNLIVL